MFLNLLSEKMSRDTGFKKLKHIAPIILLPKYPMWRWGGGGGGWNEHF